MFVACRIGSRVGCRTSTQRERDRGRKGGRETQAQTQTRAQQQTQPQPQPQPQPKSQPHRQCVSVCVSEREKGIEFRAEEREGRRERQRAREAFLSYSSDAKRVNITGWAFHQTSLLDFIQRSQSSSFIESSHLPALDAAVFRCRGHAQHAATRVCRFTIRVVENSHACDGVLVPRDAQQLAQPETVERGARVSAQKKPLLTKRPSHRAWTLRRIYIRDVSAQEYVLE
eukprot:1229060-Pleurochrysis_carterae.AAC.3